MSHPFPLLLACSKFCTFIYLFIYFLRFPPNLSTICNLCIYLIYFYQLEANYFTILSWFLPYIDINQPWVYMCSPSWTPLPPPSPSHPSGSSQCTSPEHLSHASNLGWRSLSHLIIYMFRCFSLRSHNLVSLHWLCSIVNEWSQVLFANRCLIRKESKQSSGLRY